LLQINLLFCRCISLRSQKLRAFRRRTILLRLEFAQLLSLCRWIWLKWNSIFFCTQYIPSRGNRVKHRSAWLRNTTIFFYQMAFSSLAYI
jgi:hypothetical protein